jgi:pimeloyl-ACP methyl ester carboxylesterase
MPRIVFRWLIVSVLLIVGGAAWFALRNHNRVKRIEIDGHMIEFMRRGSGSPTVVFLHGGFGGGPKLDSWSKIQQRVDAPVFTYSRPGHGNSAPAKDQRTLVQIVDELHTLLGRVGIRPPYVLVGGSLGGLYSRAFAMKYPREVAGLVLIDGTHERQFFVMHQLDPVHTPNVAPDDPQWKMSEFAGMAPVFQSGQLLGIEGKLPDVPMAVLTSLHHGQGKDAAPPATEELWRKLNGEVFQSTTYGMHIVTAKSGHNIGRDEPELVLNAIRWVLDAARDRIKHSPPPKN